MGTQYLGRLVQTTLYTLVCLILASTVPSKIILAFMQTLRQTARCSTCANLMGSLQGFCAPMAQFSTNIILCVTGGITWTVLNNRISTVSTSSFTRRIVMMKSSNKSPYCQILYQSYYL